MLLCVSTILQIKDLLPNLDSISIKCKNFGISKVHEIKFLRERSDMISWKVRSCDHDTKAVFVVKSKAPLLLLNKKTKMKVLYLILMNQKMMMKNLAKKLIQRMRRNCQMINQEVKDQKLMNQDSKTYKRIFYLKNLIMKMLR